MAQPPAQHEATPRPVVIDADPGADDAQAIAMMLSAERRRELRVLALTITFGNSTLKHCTRNARRILSVLDRLDIPIYQGAYCGLVNGKVGTTDLFHGENGLGDAHFEDPLPKVKKQEEHAANALVRLAREYKGELTILALAPLTNIAMAIRLDPEFVSNVKNICIMGGNFTGLGNATPSSEFNFFTDPEAANIVLASSRRPVTMVTWELCLNHELGKEWREHVLGSTDTAAARLFNASEAHLLQRSDYHRWVSCDQVAAAILIRPQIALKAITHHATVELQGQYSRGQMVVDRRQDGETDEARLNVNIVETLDVELYKKMLFDAFGHSDIEF